MRAIPSPAESTTPVSRTSSCFSNSLICSRMTSLISAARICIDLSPRRLRAALAHLLPQTAELRLQAAIVHGTPGVEHDPTQKVRIDLEGREHLASAGEPARQLHELVLLGRS